MGEGVDKGLKDDDAAEPAMDQVVSIKRNAQKGDERIVSPSEEEKRDLLGRSQGVKSATETETCLAYYRKKVNIPC